MFPRFLVVGSLGFVVDAGLTHLLILLGVHPMIARPPSTALAMVVTWWANRRYTFSTNVSPSARELLRYVAVALSAFTLNVGVYSLLVLAGWLPILAIIAASVLQLGLSFFGSRYFGFRTIGDRP